MYRLALAFLILLAGCQQEIPPSAETLDEATISEIQTAVAARMDELIAYSEAGALESGLNMFDQSGPGSYIDGTNRYASFQSVLDSYRANWNVASQEFEDPKTQVFVLSPDVALASASTDVSGTNTLGTPYPLRSWAITLIWIRKDGQWQIHSMHQVATRKESSSTN